MPSLYKEDSSYLSGRRSWGNSLSLYVVGYVGIDFSRQCCLHFAQANVKENSLETWTARLS